MKQYWESLRPSERRGLMVGAFVVFLVLNYFFVWPHRHDWARDEKRGENAKSKIDTYEKEISKKRVYEAKLRELQADGSQVVPEDQAIDFVHFYSSRLLNNHVLLLNGGTLTTRTNAFFMEQQLGISVQADETNLVNFLYSLAAGNSMVRVRSMSLHPNPDHHELNANITMVASYQKKAPPAPRTNAPAATPAKANTPAPKPTPTPAAKAPAPLVNGRPMPPSGPGRMPTGPGRMPPPPPGGAPSTNKLARFLRPGISPTNK